jgi:hypothetical protein
MDWIGVVVNFIGWYLLPTKKTIGYSIFIVGNFVWLLWAMKEGIYSIIFVQLVYIGLNSRAIVIEKGVRSRTFLRHTEVK